ncbi:reverse transcriptase domain-containing protein [Tanacetum coccineum]
MERTMKRYEVNHRFSTSYHPQTSGQVKNTKRAIKRILEKTVKDNPAIWSTKLDDALWAFCTAYKTPTGTTPYKLIYGKNCHLTFEIVHRAYWALKNCNPDFIAAGEKQMFQLHELDELRHQAYENSIIMLTSDSSNGNNGVSSEGPSITSIPKEGQSIARRSKERIPKELLEWYGYDTVEDYLLVAKKAIPKVIFKSPIPIKGCVLGLANVETWDNIVKKFRMRTPERCADKSKEKRKV